MSEYNDDDTGRHETAASQDKDHVRRTGTGRSVQTSDDGRWLRADEARFSGMADLTGVDRDWPSLSRQVWQISRLAAAFLFFAMVVGWPLGDWLAHRGDPAGWSLLSSYPAGIVMFALVVPALLLFAGYILSRSMTTAHAAEVIADSARAYTEPSATALREVETVGEAVRDQIDTLNEGIDGALMRLAKVEAMIRTHVDAIETAGVAIEDRSNAASERVAAERDRLMELTETLNAKAEAFAQSITERTEAGAQTLNAADEKIVAVQTRFDERLGGLETAADRALKSFELLRTALHDVDQDVKAKTENLEKIAADAERVREKANKSLDAARADSEKAFTQALQEEARKHNREAIESAIRLTSEEAGKTALDLARKEARRIANEAVGSASQELTKVARQTGGAMAVSADQAEEIARAREEAFRAAQEELAKENARLERLIDEQRARAERLANAIAQQTEQLGSLSGDAQAKASTAAKSVSSAPAPATTRIKGSMQKSGKLETLNQPFFSPGSTQPARLAESAESKGQPVNSPHPDDMGAKAILKPDSMDGNGETGMRGSAAAPLAAVKPREKDLDRLGALAKDLSAKRRQSSSEDTAKEATVSANSSASVRQTDAPTRADTRPVNGAVPVSKETKPWREILADADKSAPIELRDHDKAGESADKKPQKAHARAENMAPAKPAAAPASPVSDNKTDNNLPGTETVAVIMRLQDFTRSLDLRLYGQSPSGLVDRFERGERNIFADRLLRLNEADLKKRIRLECAKDKTFDASLKMFLKDFDGLLENAAQSEFVDEELREYLGSPLGRMYLLIGEIVGYFA